MKQRLLVALIVLCSVIAIVQSELLANSGYPINRANPQRNNHINRHILCSAISNGKTTVLQREKTVGEPLFFPYWIPPVLDDQNYLYSQINHNTVVKVDLSAFNITESVSFTDTHITVGTNNLFLSSATTTAIYRKSDLQQVATNANTGGDGESSLAPYSSDIMIRAQIGESSASTAPSYVFLNTSTGLFSSTQEVPLVGSPRDAIIYKTDSIEFPIFVGQSNDISNTPNVVISAGPGRYAVNISNAGLLYKTDPFVVDNRLLVFTDTNHIYHFNAETGDLMRKVTWNLYGTTNLVNSVMIKGSKALASLEITDPEQYVIVELYTNMTVLSDLRFVGNPVFSLTDNVVLMSVADPNTGYIKLLGLDWDSWDVKVVGDVGAPSNLVASEPVIGEDCNVYIIVDGDLQVYKPLPLQKVVPVIECIESDNTAYFSYDNLEARSFNIPFVTDRNNLYPMAQAPVTSFNIGSSAHYPLSPSIVLTTNPSASYKWILEDYTLEFANTPALRCPTNITLQLKFTANSSFDVPSFSNIVLNAFLNVTGIRETRVVIGNITSRSTSTRAVHQSSDSSLELELQVGSGNQSEPSSSRVVMDFVTNQQTEFNNQVSNDPNAPSNVALTSVTTKQPDAAQRGVPNPAAPTNEPPVVTVPQSAPVTSSSSTVMALSAVIKAFIVLVCLI